jgi:hypothetical protein
MMDSIDHILSELASGPAASLIEHGATTIRPE